MDDSAEAGMRGRLVSKQGQLMASALVAEAARGIGHAFQQISTTSLMKKCEADAKGGM